MDNIASANINRFGTISSQSGFESPSEESVFVLTSSQLQEIIARAVQPLQDRIES